MQPYIFPYIGYYQLINYVDKFVVYDDVNFIKQGWINRNNLLVQGKPFLFTIPLKEPSSFSKINEIYVNYNLFIPWKNKFLKTLEQSYKKAPYFQNVYDLVEKVMDFTEAEAKISEIATKSIVDTCNYLHIDTQFVLTSAFYENDSLSGKERVIDICEREGASRYINPIGGQELYDKDYFKSRGLELNFMKSQPLTYKQFNNEHIPWLSIIDVLMFNSVEEVKGFLDNYDLI